MVLPARAREEPTGRSLRRRRAGRLTLAVAVSLGVAYAVWALAPQNLPRPVDIVGYPSFWNYNFTRSFLGYRLLVGLVPLGTIALYWLLSRRGPLAEPRSRGYRPIELVDHLLLDRPASNVASGRLGGLLRVLRLLPPAAVVALALSSGPGSTDHVTVRSILVGLVYVPAVLASSVLLRSGVTGTADRISAVNAFAAPVVACLGIGYFASSTTVYAVSGSARSLPWLPWWAVITVLVATVLLTAGLLRRGWQPERLERLGVFFFAGAAAVYLMSTAIPGQLGYFQGFDDMQSVTGADLLARGLFPWRDYTFIHGLFEDALRSSVGFALFERSMWGTYAALGLIWIPLLMVGFYLLGVWAAPRRGLTLVCLALVSTWTLSYVGPAVRWVGMCLVFVLLGEAVRRSSPRWVAWLTACLFVEAVLVPEAAFQVIAVAVVLVTVDLAHRPPDQVWWRSLRLTGAFVVSGLVLTTLSAVVLAANGALGDFIDYFRIFGPGHAASGAFPLEGFSQVWVRRTFYVIAAMAVLTIGWVAWRLFSRRSMSSRAWVTFGCAILAALYGEKALGRFDDGHLFQSFTASAPLLVMWLVVIVAKADDAVRAVVARFVRRSRRLEVRMVPVSALVVVLALVVPNGVANVGKTPTGNQTTVEVREPELPLLGYTDDELILGHLVRDLDALIARLGGTNAEVFDFSNNPGIFYYLLQRDPPTQFFHVSMAVPELAQEMVVEQLREAPPELVVFDSWYFGLPGWDGPHNMVRHFLVSDYLLDGWTPVVRAQGMLFMLRDDLLTDMPALPELSGDVYTEDLAYGVPACDWGNSADFLESSPRGESVALRVSAPRPNRHVTTVGWAVDGRDGAPADDILLAVGDDVLQLGRPDVPRPDVADFVGNPDALGSGFSLALDTERTGEVAVYATSNGLAHPVPPVTGPLPDSLRLPNGSRLDVSDTPAAGNVDAIEIDDNGTSAVVTVPRGVELDRFDLATFTASLDIGESYVRLTNGLPDTPSSHHSVAFRTLPDSDESVSVRVGSCLQWHGFDSRRLRLIQTGGAPVQQVVLSGVEG